MFYNTTFVVSLCRSNFHENREKKEPEANGQSSQSSSRPLVPGPYVSLISLVSIFHLPVKRLTWRASEKDQNGGCPSWIGCNT